MKKRVMAASSVVCTLGVLSMVCLGQMFSCRRSEKICCVDDFPINGCLTGIEHEIPVSIETPITRIAVFQHNLLTASLSSNRETPIFRLYHLPDMSLMTSFGMRGHGHNEFVSLSLYQWIEEEDGFMVYDNNRRKMVFIAFDGDSFYIDEEKSYTYPSEYAESSMNGNQFISDEISISWTNVYTESRFEYELWNTHKKRLVRSFSPWPNWVPLGENLPIVIYIKYNILNEDKSRFAAFYRNFKCWRLFTTEGRLLKEIHVENLGNRDIPGHSMRRAPYYCSNPVADGKNIYILCESNENGTPLEYLEVWTWDGEPVARFRLDRELDHFAIEGNVMYGVDNSNIYEDGVMKIIEYKLPTEVIGQ